MGDAGGVQRGATQGIVIVKTLAKNQNGVVVISFERTMLVPKRGHAVDDKADY